MLLLLLLSFTLLTPFFNAVSAPIIFELFTIRPDPFMLFDAVVRRRRLGSLEMDHGTVS